MKSSVMKPPATLSASAAKLRLLKKLRCTLRYEKKAWAAGARLVAGVDEVGRGSLFGCVVAAAVILDPAYRVRGLRDSKLLLPVRREVLAERIREHAVAWAVAAVDAARIDQINIYHASRAAMREAVLRLSPAADHLLVDALRLDCEQPQIPIIHGDALSASIAAASILAKVERDRMMCEWGGVSRLRPGLAQGIQHAQAPRGAAGTRANASASAVICASLAESSAAGGVWIYAGRGPPARGKCRRMKRLALESGRFPQCSCRNIFITVVYVHFYK